MEEEMDQVASLEADEENAEKEKEEIENEEKHIREK